MTPKQVEKASELLRARNIILHRIKDNSGVGFVEEDKQSHLWLPPEVVDQIKGVMLALVESRLRELGVDLEEQEREI